MGFFSPCNRYGRAYLKTPRKGNDRGALNWVETGYRPPHRARQTCQGYIRQVANADSIENETFL